MATAGDADRQPMTEDELRTLCSAEETDSIGGNSGVLASQREKAMQFYLGEPLGNEEEGRSQVVTTDVADTIEWIMPALMKIFTAGDEVVRFDPTGPEDEQAARQATDYCNWVFNQQNNGFLVLYDFLKDGLLQKNGIIKTWWEETEEKQSQTIGPIDDDAYAILQLELAETGKKQRIEITAHTETDNEDGTKGHEITLTRTVKSGQVRCEGVPPEEFLISKRAKTIGEANYCAHRFRKSRAKLIEEGYDRAKVMALPADNSVASTSSEADTRNDNAEETTGGGAMSHRKGVLEEVWMVEEYVLCDFDGDGIAEYRKVLRASGASGPILKHEDWEGGPPFSSGAPILMPHRWSGISIAEQVMDLQLIKSQIVRQVIDNLYQSNHPEMFVSDKVDLDDLLVTRLGKFNRLKDGAMPADGHVFPVTVPFTAGASLPILEYIDSLRENRTGVTRYNQGIDADSLNKTARGISQIMSAAQQRIELIARIFAETGIKDLFWQILKVSQRHQTKPQVIQLRNKWVQMNPQEWRSKFNLSVSVGLGTGNQDQMLMHLQLLFGILSQVVQAQGAFGVIMVKPEHIANLIDKLAFSMGFKNAEGQFYQQPEQLPQQAPPPDPRMLKVQQDGEIGKAKLQLQKEKQDGELALKRDAQQADQALAAADHGLAVADHRLSRDKVLADFLTKAAGLIASDQQKREQMQQSRQAAE